MRREVVGAVLASGLRDAAEARIVMQEAIAGVQCFLLKGGAVTGNDQPVGDFVAQHFDGTKRGELATEGFIRRVDGFREDEPDTVILGGLGVIAQHADDPIAEVDGVSGKHAADFRFEGRQRFENKGVGRRFSRGVDALPWAGHAGSG